MKIEAKFTHETVDHAKENEVHAVVSFTAPKTNWQKDRRPICIIPVVDTSTSMGDDNKIEYAKQSVAKLVDHIQPGDYCGLVAFSTGVYSIAEPREMTQAGKDALKADIGKLQSHGWTNFAGGMRQALEWINATDLAEKYILRVIMFTDGQANKGEATHENLIPLCEKLLDRATLSAFGYGKDCDHELLGNIAKAGKGNYAFIKNPDDALTAFGRELGGLLSVYGQNIVINVAPHNGHEIVEVMSDVDVEEKDNQVIVKVPEILSEEVRHIVLKVKTSKQSQALPRAMSVLDVNVSYDQFVDGEKTSRSEEVKAKIKFVKSGEEQKDPTADVIEIVGLAKVVQAQIEAEEFAKAGNFQAAQGVMAGNAAWCASLNLHDHASHSRGLGAKMSSQAVYASNVGYVASSRKGLTRGVANYDEEAAQDMCFVNSSMPTSTSAQSSTEDSFGQSSDSPGGDSPGASTHTVVGNDLNSVAGSVVIPDPVAAVETKAKTKSKTRSNRW